MCLNFNKELIIKIINCGVVFFFFLYLLVRLFCIKCKNCIKKGCGNLFWIFFVFDYCVRGIEVLWNMIDRILINFFRVIKL